MRAGISLKLVRALSAAICLLGASPSEAQQAWDWEREAALRQARAGDPIAALKTLERLHEAYPADRVLESDLIVVSGWAGHDDAVIRRFRVMEPGPYRDYLLEAVGLAYRHLKLPVEALAIYRRGLAQSPGNSDLAAGEISSLADLGATGEAILSADANLKRWGERLEVLLAAGYAATAQGKPVEALRYLDRALLADPASRQAVHDRLLAIALMGAPQVSLALDDASPGALSAAERRKLEGDAAAALVRWGVFEPASEGERFAATDRALAVLDALILRWSVQGPEAHQAILRARFDRMVALRDRVRMAEVMVEYDDLVKLAVPIPGYVLVAAADASLYLRRPEQARALYIRGLSVDPRNPETRLALFYAYVDLDELPAAYRQVDAAQSDQAVWLYIKGLNDPQENPDHAAAELAAAEARLYADDLAEAHRRIAKLAEAAPNNTRYVSALANLYSVRGWPRQAEAEFEISRSLNPKSAATETAQARNFLNLRDYPRVPAPLADLKRRFPEDLGVQRLDRLWHVHNMAEFRLTVEQALRADASVQGGSGIAIDAQLYSPPIVGNWRLFGAEYVARERLPSGEGTIALRRSGVGVEYRDRDFRATLEGAVSAYGGNVDTVLTSGGGSGRAGARGTLAWSPDDHWLFGLEADSFARGTPLRALRAGVTARSGLLSAAYRVSESRQFELTAEAMSFSDRNQRGTLAGQYTERLLTVPYWSIDGTLRVAGSGNSADTERRYFNPGADGVASAGLAITQAIYRRYEFSYDHRLVVTPGVYWERGYGSAGVASLLYEHRLRADDVLEFGLGLTLARQPYAGAYENSAAVLLNIIWRFGP